MINYNKYAQTNLFLRAQILSIKVNHLSKPCFITVNSSEMVLVATTTILTLQIEFLTVWYK